MEGDRDTERQRRGHRVRQGETEMHAVRQTEEARVGTAVSQTQRGARSRGGRDAEGPRRQQNLGRKHRGTHGPLSAEREAETEADTDTHRRETRSRETEADSETHREKQGSRETQSDVGIRDRQTDTQPGGAGHTCRDEEAGRQREAKAETQRSPRWEK